MRKPELHIQHEERGFTEFDVKKAKENKKYIGISLSKEAIGDLLQGKHVALYLLNDEYELEGMVDIKAANERTDFEMSDELNDVICSSKIE